MSVIGEKGKNMEQTHLTLQDIMKYLDSADLSEEYLLWMDQVAEHLTVCTKCQEMLHRAMDAEYVCEQEGFANIAAMASQEEKIRKDILICKLLQMQQKERLATVIHLLQQNTVLPYILQLSDCGRGMGVSRGNDTSEDAGKVDFVNDEGQLLVKLHGSLPGQKKTIILEREGAEPLIQEAFWDEEGKCLTAHFQVDSDAELEVYVL